MSPNERLNANAIDTEESPAIVGDLEEAMVNAATQELNELKRQTQRQDAHPLHPTYPHLLVRVPFDAARIGHSLEGILNHPPQPHTPRVETNTHMRDPQSTGSQEPGSASSRIAIAALTRTSMNPCMHANNPQEEEALGPQDDLSYTRMRSEHSPHSAVRFG